MEGITLVIMILTMLIVALVFALAIFVFRYKDEKAKNEQLDRDYQLALKKSITDPLTGLYNRRYLAQRLSEEISRAKRHNHSLYLMVIDLDNFKAVNDRLGHAAGDQTLNRVAAIFRTCLRSHDVIARSGGDEFVIILPEITWEQVNAIAERIVKAISELPISHEIRISASVGLRAVDTNNSPLDELNTADQMMYQAKNGGKGKVVVSVLDNEVVIR